MIVYVPAGSVQLVLMVVADPQLKVTFVENEAAPLMLTVPFVVVPAALQPPVQVAKLIFKEVLKNNNIIYKNQSFDANLEAVEYDFTLMRNGKKIGVSAKRTLRERYKQNHEDIDKLEVDAMFLITLGIDLNEDKIRYITHKVGNYIFVAADLYEKTSFFQENEKVYPLNLLSNDLIDKIIKEK